MVCLLGVSLANLSTTRKEHYYRIGSPGALDMQKLRVESLPLPPLKPNTLQIRGTKRKLKPLSE